MTEAKVDRRILKTKEAINKAFIELMSEKDFDQITINDISERANVNRGTIYLHYSDKIDLLNKCIEDHLSQMSNTCGSVDPKQDFIHSFLPVFEYFEDNYLFYSSMLLNKGVPSFRDRMQQMVITGINEQLNMKAINQSLSRDVLGQFMASAFIGVLEWWIINKMPHPPQAMAEQMRTLFERNQIIG